MPSSWNSVVVKSWSQVNGITFLLGTGICFGRVWCLFLVGLFGRRMFVWTPSWGWLRCVVPLAAWQEHHLVWAAGVGGGGHHPAASRWAGRQQEDTCRLPTLLLSLGCGNLGLGGVKHPLLVPRNLKVLLNVVAVFQMCFACTGWRGTLQPEQCQDCSQAA